MVPTKGECLTSPVDPLGLIKIENIPTKIPGEIESILIRNIVIGFGCQIIKIQPCTVIKSISEWSCKYVNVGSATSDEKWRLIFLYWSLKCKSTEYASNTTIHFKLFIVPFFHSNIENRRNSSSKSWRDPAFIKFHIFHSIRIEDRKETEHMRRVVNRSFI